MVYLLLLLLVLVLVLVLLFLNFMSFFGCNMRA
jgi:hypothetical protein